MLLFTDWGMYERTNEEIVMEKLKPKLFSVMKTYTKEQFVKDVIAGIIVAIIALPLSIALALASGVNPERGLYTAIVAGFIIAFLGGSRVQISGPTAAFATIVAGIVASDGIEGLAVATIMAGIFLILMGVLRLGGLIRFIPYTITTGFTAGIAVTIAIGQVKDFLGLQYEPGVSPIETVDKVKAVCHYIGTINVQALLVGLACMAVLILWPMLTKVLKGKAAKIVGSIPPSLLAVILGIALVSGLELKVNTIGTLYEISNKPPMLQIPTINFKLIQAQFGNALTIAILAAVESLLSCVVSDSMINSRHRSNMELIAQGTGNIASALFGGIPATGAIARTAANVKNGGRTPISGMVHSVVLLLILVVLMPYAALIPMPAIAAILFMVAYNMCGFKEFAYLVKTSPKSDISVLLVTFVLTVVFDLVVAIEVGIIVAAVLFMKRMSDVTQVEGWRYIHDEDDPDSIELRSVPDHTMVYEISGPMFFAAADKLLGIHVFENTQCLIIRMRSVNAIDATAMHNLEQLMGKCREYGVHMILSHVNEQPLKVMQKSGFYEKVGEENFCAHIDDAIKRAEQYCEAE